jgi:hypothetical protein
MDEIILKRFISYLGKYSIHEYKPVKVIPYELELIEVQLYLIDDSSDTN